MTPKEKIKELIKDNGYELHKNEATLYEHQLDYVVEDIIRYISEATGIDISTLKDKEEKIV